MADTTHNLASGFYKSSERFPEKMALAVAGKALTYIELRQRVQPVAAWIRQATQDHPARVGILASRSLSTYLGILGTSWAGDTYVPISPKLPPERLAQLLERIPLGALIVDAESANLLTPRVLALCPSHILSPEFAQPSGTTLEENNRVVLSGHNALPSYDPQDVPQPVEPGDVAYIILTSGTTGIPKGVMVPASAVAQFVKVMRARYDLQPHDRAAGITEITFDISVFDMFVMWSCGGALLVVPPTQLMAPISFIQKEKPTIVFTVPSIATNMKKMKLLVPGSMPSVRYSFFAGEPLPVASAEAWGRAAAKSVVENLFGPTEATVVCIGQRFHGPENATPERGIVATGTPFEGMQAGIFGPALEPLAPEEQGELLLSGPQLACGYFEDEELSGKRFPVLNGRRWYRTGDLAYRDSSGIFHHLGRIDNQVKVRGLRVELEEIEAYLRTVYKTDSVAAVAWPIEHGSASGIVAFVSGGQFGEAQVQKGQMRNLLPSYMLPSRVHQLDALPLNENGKVDRKELTALLDQGKL